MSSDPPTAYAATLSMIISVARAVSPARVRHWRRMAWASFWTSCPITWPPIIYGPRSSRRCSSRARTADLERDPASFVDIGGRVLANGRDPYFPAWPDVVQLNAFAPALRAAMIDTLHQIADQCDGVRCDMAMLVMNDVFARTWGDRVGPAPSADYWPTVIPAVREAHPGFLFLAEAYWDLEWALQQQGFNYCYDKRLYDRILHGPAEQVRLHLLADDNYQHGLVRFVENHDEPRAVSAFGSTRSQVAAVTALTQTGARLVHNGQLEGATVHLPVFLGRYPKEASDEALLALLSHLPARRGRPDIQARSLATVRTVRMAGRRSIPKPGCLVLGWRLPLAHRGQSQR